MHAPLPAFVSVWLCLLLPRACGVSISSAGLLSASCSLHRCLALGAAWSVSSSPCRPLWHASPPPAHAFCLSFFCPTRTGMPKAGPDRRFGILIMGVPMGSKLRGSFYSRDRQKGLIVFKRLLVTQPYLPFSISPLAPFHSSSFPDNFLLHFVAFGLFFSFLLLLPLLLKRSVPVFVIQLTFLYDWEVQTIQLEMHCWDRPEVRKFTPGWFLCYTPKKSLEAARSVAPFPSQMHHLYTNNLNHSKALFKNLLQTKNKHVCVLWSMGCTLGNNIQGGENNSKNMSRQGCCWNSQNIFLRGDCYVSEMIWLTEGWFWVLSCVCYAHTYCRADRFNKAALPDLSVSKFCLFLKAQFK